MRAGLLPLRAKLGLVFGLGVYSDPRDYHNRKWRSEFRIKPLSSQAFTATRRGSLLATNCASGRTTVRPLKLHADVTDCAVRGNGKNA